MKLVILDRDGTINESSEEFVKTPEEWHPLPGVLEAIARLNHAGFQVVVVSNQGGLGRGLFDMAQVNAMHAKMHKLLAAAGGRVEAVFFCPHGPEEECRCRMPSPGLFEQIAERYGIHLQGVPMAGDSLRDLQAGAAAGCEPHLVLTGLGAQWRDQVLPDTFPAGTRTHADVGAFADFVIANEARRLAACS
ncbi:MAG: D-glycero-beta-D-manno-heptose 1,7-bisphosphate 7-phosphatase [Curvibacter sp.]|nr:D-glycero-beta-D-manno-heptose 1,7-bisphosphate 7-phosphatase [Curvibacter sp.]